MGDDAKREDGKCVGSSGIAGWLQGLKQKFGMLPKMISIQTANMSQAANDKLVQQIHAELQKQSGQHVAVIKGDPEKCNCLLCQKRAKAP